MSSLRWLIVAALWAVQSSGCASPLLQSPAASSLYQDNGGTAVAVAGRGFAVIAADTRIIRGHSVLAKTAVRLHQISRHCVLATTNCHADGAAAVAALKRASQAYSWRHGSSLSAAATSTLLSNLLFRRRVFPYLANCLTAGILPSGDGFVCAFDPIGSAERLPAACTGAGAPIIQPLLDQYAERQCSGAPLSERAHISEKASLDAEQAAVDEGEVRRVCGFVRNCFRAAAERDIAVGSSVEMCVVTSAGVSLRACEDDDDRPAVSLLDTTPAGSSSLGQRVPAHHIT